MSRVIGDNLAETGWERILSLWDAFKYHKKDHPEVDWGYVDKKDRELISELRKTNK